MKINVEDIADYLYELEENNLSELGMLYLKDELLDLSEFLHQKEVTTGWKYEDFVVIVEKGKTIPQPYRGYTLTGGLSGEKYTVKVKEITGLRWNEEGNLIVDIVGIKVNS